MLKSPFNLPDKAYQFWKPFNYFGVSYCFDHLISCRHTFSHPDRDEQYTLYFTFSHHVFTKKTNSEDFQSDLIYLFPLQDLRLFDKERYELSKYLPEIVKTLPEQFFYHGGYTRYCTCKIDNSAGEKVYYQVVYRVWREKGKLRFHIESAYPLEEKLGKVKKVNFWVICHNLLKNKNLPKPAK